MKLPIADLHGVKIMGRQQMELQMPGVSCRIRGSGSHRATLEHPPTLTPAWLPSAHPARPGVLAKWLRGARPRGGRHGPETGEQKQREAGGFSHCPASRPTCSRGRVSVASAPTRHYLLSWPRPLGSSCVLGAWRGHPGRGSDS